MSFDKLASALSRTVDIIFLDNPGRTSIGVLSGVVLEGLIRILPTGYLPANHLQHLNIFYYIAAGVVFANIPAIFRRRTLPQDIEQALFAIREARRKGILSDMQAKMAYHQLIQSMLERIQTTKEPLARPEQKKRTVPERPA